MTIHFKKLRYQNILSTGNQFTEIDLNRSSSTLIVGENGAGKCVHKSTTITVEMDDETYQKFLTRSVYSMIVNTTVGEITEFLETYPEYRGRIKVETRFGFKPIEAAGITAKNSPVIKVETYSGEVIKVSPDHLLLSDNIKWTKAKDLSAGNFLFTRDGATKIKKIKYLKTKEDLYDIQVAEVKEYYANNIVSHNSTIIEALTFALYGKPYRNINKPQLLNSITNKNLLVELEFSIGNKEYTVRRGMKPNIFELWLDGVMLNQNAGARDYQEFLERNILKLNFKSFSQIVVLGSANYVPFMQLPSAQRRAVVEDLLDIQIFSVMNSLLKDKQAQNKADATDVDYQIHLTEQKIEMHNKHIKTLKTNNEDLVQQKQKKIDEHEIAIQSLEADCCKINIDVQALMDNIADQEKTNIRKSKLVQLESTLEDRVRKLNKEIQFFHDYDNCPTCKQGIEHNFKTETIEKRKIKTAEVNEALFKLEQEIQSVNTRIDEMQEYNKQIQSLNAKITENNQQINYYRRFIRELESDIENLRDQANAIQSESADSQLLNDELKSYGKQKEALSKQRAVIEAASQLLKDSGIKTKIIKQYVPIMNKLINKYLAALDFFVSFELDEQFNETLKSRFRDEFTYASFSEGEKLRIDLALMFTWRAIAKLRNSASTNLLIMDEVFDSSLDATGTEEFINILESLTENTNVFIISHKGDAMQDKFHSVIKFEKSGNFSRIAS